MPANSWFPLFEFQDWTYQSFLILPTAEEDAALPGTPVTAKRWAKGTFLCGQAFNLGDSYKLDGTLSSRPGVEFAVSATGTLGSSDTPATFEATVTGTQALKGTEYHLVGVVFPEEPIQNNAAKVLAIRGHVRAVRGPDTNPKFDPSGMPIGTVGAFVIARAKSPGA